MDELDLDLVESHLQAKHRRASKRRIYKEKLKKLMHKTCNYPTSYSSGPWMQETSKGKWIKYTQWSGRKFYKKCTYKKIRNSKELFSTREKGYLHKIFDYKWNLD